MMKIPIIIFWIVLAITAEAQVMGRFYYNRYWQLTKKDSAYYFRVAPFDTTNYVFAGPVRDFRKNGKLVMTGNYQVGKKNGEFVFMHPNGKVESKGNFVDNQRNGVWKYYYRNDTLRQEVEFTNDRSFKILTYHDSTGIPLQVNGTGPWSEEYEEANVSKKIITVGQFTSYQRDGEWTCKLEDGTILFIEKYKNGKFLKETSFPANGRKVEITVKFEDNKLLPHYKFLSTENMHYLKGVNAADYPFLKRILPLPGEESIPIEEIPVPIGGIRAFYKVVGEETNYPAQARKMGIEGKVFVEFAVERDSTLSDFRVIKGIGSGCDEEALRVVRESAKKCKWTPGRQRGKPVRAKYTLPIIFKLS